MISVSGIYEDGNIVFTEPLPENKKCKVIVTFIENMDGKKASSQFIGSLTNVGKTLADLTEPFDDEWEVD